MQTQKNTHNSFQFLKIWLLAISSFLLFSCNNNLEQKKTRHFTEQRANIDSLINSYNLKNGDIVLRKGNSIESETVSLVDGNGRYSHIGIIFFQEGIPYVIHVVPDSLKSTIDYCQKQAITDFFSKENARFGCVLRLKEPYQQYPDSAAQVAFRFFTTKTQFDVSYNLLNDSAMYCTELVWKAYHINGFDIINSNFSSSSFTFLPQKIILPSAFLKSTFLKKIYYF